MTELELAWLAGLLEGEGSFLHPAPSEPNSPRVVIVMTDRDIIERAARLLGVNYIHMSHRNAERWKPAFKVQLKGARAAELMRAVRPWMGERRGGRIDAILAGLQAGPRRLREEEARSILARRGSARARDVAADFGLSVKTVEEIWRGKRWGQLQAPPAPA